METLPPGGPTGSLKMERNPECGVYKYRPRYLQPLNSMTSFMAFYTALLIVYGKPERFLFASTPVLLFPRLFASHMCADLVFPSGFRWGYVVSVRIFSSVRISTCQSGIIKKTV